MRVREGEEGDRKGGRERKCAGLPQKLSLNP